MKDVFISYKAEEFDEAYWVKQTLESNGIRCWMAPMSIPGGASYATEIPQAIRECKVFVLILSKRAQRSKWVPRELDQAINENKTVMPFMLENCELQDDFNFYLTNVQRYAAYESKSAAIEKMINEIRAILGYNAAEGADGEAGDKPGADASPEREPAPRRKPKAPKAPKTPRKTAGDAGKKSKKPLLLLALLPVVIVLLLILKPFSQVTIAGEKYKRSAETVRITSASLSNDDLKTLSSMKELRLLFIVDSDLSRTDLTRLRPENLYSLTVQNCGLTDQEAKKLDFGRIRTLSLAENRITDLSGLHFYEKIGSLDLSGNPLAGLAPLSACAELTDLSVASCGLSSLTGLENCIRLETLDASENELSDLAGLENTTLLQKVNLRGNGISDLTVLGKSAAKLKRLLADENGITTLEAIRHCTQLTELSLDRNNLTSLQELSELTGLLSLSVEGNALTSLAGIEGCEKLRYLNASANRLTGTEPLLSLSERSYPDVVLLLSDNRIADFRLPDFTLRFLAIDGNGAFDRNAEEDYSFLSAVRTQKLIFNYHETIDFEELAKTAAQGIYTTWYLQGCPLDRQISVQDALGKYNVYFDAVDEVEKLVASMRPAEL